MENPRPEKAAVVEEVREKLSAAQAALVTEYRGLNVTAMADLRRTLRSAGGEYKVYKNTLVRFAARDLGHDLEELLTGPTAIAFVDGDAAAVAKALRDYSRTNPVLVVKGGLLGAKVLSATDVAALADLPSREVMLAQVAGALAAPMRQFAGLLQALPRNLAYGLQALIDKGGAGGADAVSPAAGQSESTPDSAATASETTTDTASETTTDTASETTSDTASTESGPADTETAAADAPLAAEGENPAPDGAPMTPTTASDDAPQPEEA